MVAKKTYVFTETVYGLSKDPDDPVRPGEPVKADPDVVAPLIARGICSEHKPEAEAPAPKQKTSKKSTAKAPPAADGQGVGDEGAADDELIGRIVLAIAGLDPENNDVWTDEGLPRVDALEDVLGEDITEAQRDAAWEQSLA